MTEFAPTPLAGLFAPAEVYLIYDAHRFTWIVLTDAVDPRVDLALTLRGGIETEALDAKWEVDAERLLAKIGALDAWEAAFLLRALAAVRPLRQERQNLGVQDALEEVGLLRPGARSVILYACGHVEDTAFRCDESPETTEDFAADRPCPSCRLSAQSKLDRKSGYPVLPGDSRTAAAGAESRGRLLPQLEAAEATEPLDQVLRDVVVRYLRQISDPRWWIERRDLDPRELVDAVSPEAIQTVARGDEATKLLNALSLRIRMAAMRALPRACGHSVA